MSEVLGWIRSHPPSRPHSSPPHLSQHFLWPPMLHTEVSTKPSLLVQIIHLHESLDPPPDRLDQVSHGRVARPAS